MFCQARANPHKSQWSVTIRADTNPEVQAGAGLGPFELWSLYLRVKLRPGTCMCSVFVGVPDTQQATEPIRMTRRCDLHINDCLKLRLSQSHTCVKPLAFYWI